MFRSWIRARWSFVVLVIVAALAGTLVQAATAPPAHALIQDRPAYTWNMQGAASDGQSKWFSVVGPMLNSPAQPVVALQEVGAGPPPSAPGTTDQYLTAAAGQLAALPPGMNNDIPSVAAAQTVRHTQWAYGGVNHDVYYLQTDPNAGSWTGGRVNLAIVTPRAADEVVIIPTPGGISSDGALRPALGVRLGSTWYFSIHAASGGGSNVLNLMDNITAFVNWRNANDPFGEDGLVLGDFNREPNTWGRLSTEQALMPDLPTHGNNYLDYAVMVEPDQIFPPGMVARTQPTFFSDHHPVQVQLATTPTPTQSAVPVFSSSRVIESMQSGGVLDVQGAGTSDFTPIDSYRRNGQSNQGWTVLGYPDGTMRFVGDGSGRCIDITHSNQNPGPGRSLSLWDCSDQASQRWQPLYVGNGEFLLESELVGGECMNLAFGQGNPSTPSSAILWGCSNIPNERFYFSPANLSTQVDHNTSSLQATTRTPAIVENMSNGGVMDVTRNGVANSTEVDSWWRNGAANQGWNLIWHSDDSVSFQGVASGRCLDIHNSNTATLGRDMVIWDCTGQQSQDFFPIALQDGQFEFESVLVSDACLETANASADPASGYEAINTCDGTGNELFTLTPFDPTGTPSPPTDPDFSS